jgi:hypothetical protein
VFALLVLVGGFWLSCGGSDDETEVTAGDSLVGGDADLAAPTDQIVQPDGVQITDNQDPDLGEDGTHPDVQEPIPVHNTGCPAESGHTVTGVARLTTLHPSPTVSGPTVVTKFPCGREVEDPSKNTCGKGQIVVMVCTTPDCSAATDPIRRHINEDGQLVQTSFDKEPFEFCGLDNGTYYIVPVMDHDANGKISNFDWTMGVKNLVSSDVAWPARVEGHAVTISGADIALGTSLTPTNPQASPVVVNYYYYRHPSPKLKAENAWLFIAAALNPDVAPSSVGIRAVDLNGWKEKDHIGSTPATDAMSVANTAGARYEGDLEKLAFADGIAYLGTNTQGVIMTMGLGADGAATQGNFIDLTSMGVDHKMDTSHFAAVLETHGRKFLAVTNRESAGKPVPHQPAYPLWIVDITDLASGDVAQAELFNAARWADLHQVRFDQILAYDGKLFAVETGANSRARVNDGLNRLWVMEVDEDGTIASHHVYDVSAYKSGVFEECSSNPPYRYAGLWVGEFNGAPHAFVGGLRSVAAFRFGAAVDSGMRIQLGEGLDKYDLPLDDYALGFSILRVSPDESKLFLFGDCKGRYLAVREGDWAGDQGVRTQSRRRTAVLDLAVAGPEGLPAVYAGYADRINVPDTVREGLNGPNQTLSASEVVGIGTDCRGILWDLYNTFGYQNIAGATFGSDCLANRVADAVVTDHHIYVIGEGAVANKTTGLGVSSEILVLDLATGQEVIHPNWQWVYDGSSYQVRYGYFGQTIGERKDVDTSKGLFLIMR